MRILLYCIFRIIFIGTFFPYLEPELKFVKAKIRFIFDRSYETAKYFRVICCSKGFYPTLA